jgi:hypothetical protein
MCKNKITCGVLTGVLISICVYLLLQLHYFSTAILRYTLLQCCSCDIKKETCPRDKNLGTRGKDFHLSSRLSYIICLQIFGSNLGKDAFPGVSWLSYLFQVDVGLYLLLATTSSSQIPEILILMTYKILIVKPEGHFYSKHCQQLSLKEGVQVRGL